MRKELLFSSAGILSLTLIGPAFGEPALLDGLWKSKTDAIYRITQRDRNVVMTYEIPNAAQIAAGIVKGDLALKGDFVANVLSGIYYQRAPVSVQESCPEFKIIDGPVQWELNDDTFTGTLMLVGGSDANCEVTKRSLSHMRLERASGDSAPISTLRTAEPRQARWPDAW